MTPTTASPVEDAFVAAMPSLLVALAVTPPLLLVPVNDDPLAVFVVQLSGLVALGLVVVVRIAPLADREWFSAFDWPRRRRRLAAVAVLVVISTGVVALATLATSAALRFDPSLQFLQLLSALDIAWATAALFLGVRWWLGAVAGRIAAVALGVACVLSVWNYLRVVGFGENGAWLVDGGELLRLVLPFDVAAAIMAVASVLIGLRRTA